MDDSEAGTDVDHVYIDDFGIVCSWKRPSDKSHDHKRAMYRNKVFTGEGQRLIYNACVFYSGMPERRSQFAYDHDGESGDGAGIGLKKGTKKCENFIGGAVTSSYDCRPRKPGAGLPSQLAESLFLPRPLLKDLRHNCCHRSATVSSKMRCSKTAQAPPSLGRLK
jgi:hypothetical protein